MSDQRVLIHVRFAPNGEVTEIGERPAAFAPQAWFNALSARLGTHYQAFSGGRGLFRVTRDELDAFQPAAE